MYIEDLVYNVLNKSKNNKNNKAKQKKTIKKLMEKEITDHDGLL